MHRHIPLLLTLLLVAACHHTTETNESPLQRGDLLFVGGDSPMDTAIVSATGTVTHVAIVDREGDSLYVIEATPRMGVVRRPYDDFLHDACSDASPVRIVSMRVTVPFDIDRAIATAKAHVGEPYDSLFLPDNGRVYCSELVTESYLDPEGTPLFPLSPMNFRDSDGILPDFWVEWFQRQNAPVPEDVLGSNPNDLSQSPLLHLNSRL